MASKDSNDNTPKKAAPDIEAEVDWGPIGMTVVEAAKSLRITPRALRTALRKGELPGKWIANKWRLDPDALRRAMDTRDDAAKDES